MLLRIMEYRDLDEIKLMDVYAESNFKNAEYFYPDETDKHIAVQKVEARFLDFMKNDFFKRTEASYWILKKDGIWVSAFRTCKVQAGLYYLEALETRPDQRKKGYASILISNVVETLKKEGFFRLCDCVSKKNIASLRTHEKCGFQIISEEGFDYIHGEADDRHYGLEYRYS
jgi:ribosomal protein S18 acetylase RimI-like enzyme